VNPWDPADCETHRYQNPDGETLTFRTLKGTAGRQMPPAVVTTLPAPGSGGSRYVGTFHGERILTLPVVDPGPLDGRPDFREWPRILDPVKGQGTLTVVQGDYPGRQLICVYESGLEAVAETDRLRIPAVLTFRAAYPYWVDETESEQVVTGEEESFFWFPFAGSFAANPIRFGPENTFANLVVSNTGDVEAWPVITVKGPATNVEMINETTGLSWQFTGDVAAGETLIVDTRPGQKLVRLDGVNEYDRLTEDSNLWPLIPGANTITMSATAVVESTYLRFGWRNAWLAA
jgi:hypothetical protein